VKSTEAPATQGTRYRAQQGAAAGESDEPPSHRGSRGTELLT